MTRAAIIQDSIGSPARMSNFYEMSSGRQHVQTFVLIYPASAPWTLVRGRKSSNTVTT